MFALIAGRVDSKTRIFNRPVVITKDDLLDLNSKVLEKLRLHSVSVRVASAAISFSGRRITEFGSFAELDAYDMKK